MRTRQRNDLATDTQYLGQSFTVVGGVNQQQVSYYCSSPRTEKCVDELHKRVRTKRGSTRWKSGGPLMLQKNTVTRTNSEFVSVSGGAYRYQGQLCCAVPGMSNNPSLGSFLTISDAKLRSTGASGIARAKPGGPVMGLGQAVGEARQLPSIPSLKKAVKSLQGLGSQYLNVEFGWKPLLNDLRDLLDFQAKIDKAFNQLRRDNGKVVRRRMTVDKTESSSFSSFTTNGTYPTLHNLLYSQSANIHKRQTYIKSGARYWFEGAFRYWIPNLESPTKAAYIKAHLAGGIPTPELVWELMPWSWLIDWFSNAGDVISNMSLNAAENLVVLYGYAMGNSWTEESYSAQTVLRQGQSIYTTLHLRKEVKARIRASPFGFGLDLPDLSARQLAILAALGLSRSKGLG